MTTDSTEDRIVQPTRVHLDQITLILTRPKYPGNIGSVARAAKNMGIHRIRVVKRGDPDMEEIYPQIHKMATHLAADVVEKIEFFQTIEEAIADATYIVGTTARFGTARRPVIDPVEMAERLIDVSQNNHVAIVFGPEDAGLSTQELQCCHDFVAIPTSDAFRSINLSHAVMIICYELFKASLPGQDKGFTPKLASSGELEGMYAQLQDMFVKIDFINPENPEYWMTSVRRMLSRLRLQAKEVKMIRGVCRQVLWYTSNKKT